LVVMPAGLHPSSRSIGSISQLRFSEAGHLVENDAFSTALPLSPSSHPRHLSVFASPGSILTFKTQPRPSPLLMPCWSGGTRFLETRRHQPKWYAAASTLHLPESHENLN
jgi:hypothetical protein